MTEVNLKMIALALQPDQTSGPPRDCDFTERRFNIVQWSAKFINHHRVYCGGEGSVTRQTSGEQTGCKTVVVGLYDFTVGA